VAIAPKEWASPCPQQIKVLRTSGLPRDEDAAARLAAVAKLMAPLMERRSWTIDELKELAPWEAKYKYSELCDADPRQGLKICSGVNENRRAIGILLRVGQSVGVDEFFDQYQGERGEADRYLGEMVGTDNSKLFCPLHITLGTALHELAHMTTFEHDNNFFRVQAELRGECTECMRPYWEEQRPEKGCLDKMTTEPKFRVRKQRHVPALNRERLEKNRALARLQLHERWLAHTCPTGWRALHFLLICLEKLAIVAQWALSLACLSLVCYLHLELVTECAGCYLLQQPQSSCPTYCSPKRL
jgi:hypothetical protein